MANEQELRIIREIAKQFGSIINLEKTPSVLAEILRNYGGRFSGSTFAGGSGCSVSATTGGVQTSGSGGAVAEPSLSDVVRGILQLQRVVSGIDVQMKDILRLNKLTPGKSTRAVRSARLKAPPAKARTKRKRS